MADSSRVAVYIDFDNVVISRYDDVFGRGSWKHDDPRRHAGSTTSDDPIDVRLSEAEIDVGAIIDYASSFGPVAMTRAYADWSAPVNAAYRRQMIDQAVELIQLFNTSGTKNGADIRLSIDAIDDLHQHGAITHIVVVAGDSDYIALAQRCKQMGRYVVGIGVAGSTSPALVRACNEFIDYARIPGVSEPTIKSTGKKTAAKKAESPPATAKKTAKKTAKAAKKAASKSTETDAGRRSGEQDGATALLVRAIRLGLKNSDDEWVYSSGVKSQMQRIDSTFDEKALGFRSFRAFVDSRSDVVESEERDSGQVRIRLR